ncbi:MAG: nicotinate (nicotinamide) nucleotide adenylyltransferase [Muribaculaceae bacterium]|nr:nicotinate (nicotinamide) nucleotide adenylyltransferase [Muribaculaceae bacterium]
MKIGIYGGSFDPIHTGHSILANFVAQCGIVDEVWITVSRKNPMKSHQVYASDTDRLKMAESVASECNNVKVCDIEMSMPVPSFTYDTLKKLRGLYPDNEFKIIIGSDSLLGFEQWRNANKIRSEFGVIVYPRPGYPLPAEEPEGMIFLCGAPEFGVSSSLVREYIRDGWNVSYFVPVSVANYIAVKNLYKE